MKWFRSKIGWVAALTIAFLIGNRLAHLYMAAPTNTNEVLSELFFAGENFFRFAVYPPSIDFSTPALAAGVVVALAAAFAAAYRKMQRKNFREGEEQGSSIWNTPEEASKFADRSDHDNNIPLSEYNKVRLSGHTDGRAYDINKNVLVIGGPGTGKTFSFVKPYIMQQHGSYVITDPKGTLLRETGMCMAKGGYEVRYFSTKNFAESLKYNPLAYIRKEADILNLVTVLMKNTTPPDSKANDPFWENAEKLLYGAIIGFLYYECDDRDRNIPGLVDLIDAADAKEEDENHKSLLDYVFEDLEERKGACFSVRQYRKYKKAAGKTAKSILISCGARLGPFDIDELRELMEYDELELDLVGDKKTALYVMMDDSNTTFNFLIAMLFYQLFAELVNRADNVHNGSLPNHVSCILDEFANIGRLPDFEVLISTLRSRRISACAIVQSIGQLENTYDKAANIIYDCCATTLFLGGKSKQTREDISSEIGAQTIDNRTSSETRGQQGSYTLNDQILKRDLMDPAEVGRLDLEECIVLISGHQPFKCKKYPTQKHKRYGQLLDANPENAFTAEKYAAIENARIPMQKGA